MPWQKQNRNSLIIRLFIKDMKGKAIAHADVVEQPLGNEFIKRYELPSTSSVKSALKVLVDKDLVYQTLKGYIVYDRFLGLWLKRI